MPFTNPSAISIINARYKQVAMNSYQQDQWLSYQERSVSQRQLSASFSCGARDPDWDFIDQQAFRELRPSGVKAAYKFASEESPMQLRNDNGGMSDESDEDDEGVDCVYPYHAGRLIVSTSAEKAMSDVPGCESGSSCEGSVIEDEMVDVMDSTTEDSFSPIVFAQEGGNNMMEMEMEMQITVAASSNNKRKRWADDDCVQHQQQSPFSTATAWGGFPGSGAKRVRVRG